jgi:hypothetical protein
MDMNSIKKGVVNGSVCKRAEGSSIKNFTRRSRLIKILVPLAMSLTASSAWSYTITQCNGGNYVRWNDATVNVRPSSTFTGTSWLQPLLDTINEVESHAGELNMTVTTGDNSVGFDNGQSEIWWTSSVIVGGTERPAAATGSSSCGSGITERDIRFNNTWNWDLSQSLSNLTQIGGSARSFRGVALHELGHLIGLGHVTDTYSIMGADSDHVHLDQNSGRHYFGEDSTRGATVLYGSTPILEGLFNDLAVTSFRRTGSNNGYSTHGPVRIFNSGGSQLATFTDANGVQGYKVNKGQSVNVEFGYENLGYAFIGSVRMRYFISTNNLISTSDLLISTQNNMQFATDVVSYWQKALAIPSNLTSGNTYYLGVIIGREDGSQDINPNNDTSYIPIRIN